MTGRKRCEWCGQYAKANTAPMGFVNVIGEPRQWLLCDYCAPDLRALAAHNVYHAASQEFLAVIRADQR